MPRSAAADTAAAILERLGPAGRLCAIDRDPDAIAAGRERFAAEGRSHSGRGSFGRLEERVRAAGLEGGLQGVLLDLGVSSPQLDEARRGFSFMQDGPLDMRMDNESGISAAQWLARAGEREIADVLFKLGEEKFSRRIARAIVAARGATPIATTRQLADIVVASAVPTREPGKHPGDAHVPGDPHPREPRARGSRGRAAAGGQPARAGRPAVRDQLPLARRPDGQALHAPRGAGRSALRRAAERAAARAAAPAARRRRRHAGRRGSRAPTRARAAPCCAWPRGSRHELRRTGGSGRGGALGGGARVRARRRLRQAGSAQPFQRVAEAHDDGATTSTSSGASCSSSRARGPRMAASSGSRTTTSAW